MSKIVAIFSFLLLLNGCIQLPKHDLKPPKKYLIASANSFHTLEGDGDASPKSFMVLMDGNQHNNLEYKYYAKLIAQHLKNYGHKEVANKGEADYVVTFDYETDSGKEYQETVPITGVIDYGAEYGHQYYNGQYWVTGSSYKSPQYGTVGVQTFTKVVYTRKFSLIIKDIKGKNLKKAENIYEGRVVSQGELSKFSDVAKAMITALFLEFPGQNAITRKIKVEIELDD